MIRVTTVLFTLLTMGLGTSSLAQPLQPVDFAIEPMTFTCQQTTCDAELWLPALQNNEARPPVIVMAHGFGALRDWGLAPFAEHFVRAGFAVLQFDFRGFGQSGGSTRRVVDGKAHVEDWHSALDAIAQHPRVDPERIGIWGVSFSGGQALAIGAERPNQIKALSALVPFVSGFSSGLQYPIRFYPKALWYALRDTLRFENDHPIYVPMISPDGFAALVCDECYEGYHGLMPADAQNLVAARIFLSLPFWSPGSSASDIQAPTLVIAAENDGLIPIGKLREVVSTIPTSEYVELVGADHFSPTASPFFEAVVARQTAFFTEQLMP